MSSRPVRAHTGPMTDPSGAVRVDDASRLRTLAGHELGPSRWTQITQARVDDFADLVDDRHWAHNEPEVAAAGPFGGTIAHAHLTLSLLPSWRSQILRIDDGGSTMFYGYNRVRFPTAVRVGCRARLRGRVLQVEEVAGAAQLTLALVVEIDGVDRPACVAEAVWRHYPVTAPH